jgi:hypothetical protein
MGALYVHPEHSGLGSQWFYYLGGMLHAVGLGRVFHVETRFGYARGCPFNRTALDCFFIAPSPCNFHNNHIHRLRQFQEREDRDNELRMPTRREYHEGMSRHEQSPHLLPFAELQQLPRWQPWPEGTEPDNSTVPFAYHFPQREFQYWTQNAVDRPLMVDPRHLDLPKPMYRAYLSLYLFRPHLWLRVFLQRQKELVGWPIHIRDFEQSLGQSPSTTPHLYRLPNEESMRTGDMVIGMHVRTGDKVLERGSTLPNLTQYHQEALEYQRKYGFRSPTTQHNKTKQNQTPPPHFTNSQSTVAS